MNRQPDLATLSEARAIAVHGLRELLREMDFTEAAWLEQLDAFLAGRIETIHLTYALGDFLRFETIAELVKDVCTDSSPA